MSLKCVNHICCGKLLLLLNNAKYSVKCKQDIVVLYLFSSNKQEKNFKQAVIHVHYELVLSSLLPP